MPDPELDPTPQADRPPDPSWELAIGAEIDPSLVVIGHLGGGSRYEVFHAWDRTLFCQVAVKVVRPNRVEDDRALAGFEREVAIAERLAHPNLVRLLRWEPRPPRPYMVFEYITAQTLAAHLADEGEVSVPETCLLGIRMLSALHYLHSRSVLHLDVKPDNLTMGDPPRLLDLSLARTFAGPLKMRHTIGTPVYMPPEQCDHGYVTPQSDLFSLGATLYEGLTGIQAFSTGEPDATVRADEYPQLVEEAQPISDTGTPVPRRLEHAILSCLEKDPKRRPRSAIDLAIELEAVLEELNVEELQAWPKGTRVRPK